MLLLAVGLYFAPRDVGPSLQDGLNLPFDLNLNPARELAPSADTPVGIEALFKKSRPASVRIEQRSRPGGPIEGIGTGFFIDKTGTLLTAYHVVEGARYLNVTTSSQRSFRAEVVGFDAARDIAVLKAAVRGDVAFVNLAPQRPRPGDRVLAIGNSGGDFLQPRRGRLLRLDAKAARADFPQGTLEMNAPLAPGDSGGPIFNTAGQAIGVVSYIRIAGYHEFEGGESIPKTLASYAVPVTASDATVQALRRGEKRDVPAMGVSFSNAEPVDGVRGAVIVRVTPGSPAARAGLRGSVEDSTGRVVRAGDVITAVDGNPTSDYEELLFQVRQKRIGDTVTLSILRGSRNIKVDVKLGPKAVIFAQGQ